MDGIILENEKKQVYIYLNGEVRCECLIKGDYSKVIFAFPEGFKPKKRGIFLIYRQIMRLIELMLMKKEKFILAANILI